MNPLPKVDLLIGLALNRVHNSKRTLSVEEKYSSHTLS